MLVGFSKDVVSVKKKNRCIQDVFERENLWVDEFVLREWNSPKYSSEFLFRSTAWIDITIITVMSVSEKVELFGMNWDK